MLPEILRLLWPLLAKALERWLEELLKRADTRAGEGASVEDILDSALSMTSKWRAWRIALLTRLRRVLPNAVAVGELNEEDAKELQFMARWE